MTSEAEVEVEPEVAEKVAEIRRLEADIRKELGLLQLRMKMEKNDDTRCKQKKSTAMLATSLGFREHVTLLVVVFVLLFAVSPVFRNLVVAAYKHYFLGLDLASSLRF